MTQRKISYPLIIAIAFLMIYLALFAFAQSRGIYNINLHTNNDRFFSMDDSYYINHFYSTEPDDTGRVVKHPLLVAFAHYFTLLERSVLGEISTEHHYMLVVLFQILVQTIAVVYLFRMLTEHYKLTCLNAALLTLIYGLSCASLLFMLIAESYIFSGALLILTQWFILQKKPAAVVIAGILLGGMTITNIFIWGILVLFYDDKFYKRAIMAAAGGLGLLGAIWLLPVRDAFYTQCLKVFQSSPANYSDNFLVLEALKRGFYALFGSTYFFIDTVDESPFGKYQGQAVSFIPSAPFFINVIAGIWLLLMVYSLIGNRKNALIRGPLMVLLFNIALHVVKQYGLKEGSLYSLHHSFAQILIIACILSGLNGKGTSKAVSRTVSVFLIFFMVIMSAVNLKGIFNLF